MDRLTSLTVFIRVVEGGGFSAGARRLKNMSVTAASGKLFLQDHSKSLLSLISASNNPCSENAGNF
jgi:hypothetical protein